MIVVKHSPNPWEAIEMHNAKGSYFKVYAGETSVCNIITRNQEQAEANANLIAAAPELLELAREYVKVLRFTQHYEETEILKIESLISNL